MTSVAWSLWVPSLSQNPVFHRHSASNRRHSYHPYHLSLLKQHPPITSTGLMSTLDYSSTYNKGVQCLSLIFNEHGGGIFMAYKSRGYNTTVLYIYIYTHATRISTISTSSCAVQVRWSIHSTVRRAGPHTPANGAHRPPRRCSLRRHWP